MSESPDATLPVRPPKLIATDLDGTLLQPDGSVSDRTRRALSGLTDAGIELVFVTARPPRWVDHLADLAGAHGTVICANGAFVYDVSRRTVIEAYGMSPATVRDMAADLRRALPGVGFAAELAEGVHREREYPELHPEVAPTDGTYGAIDAVDQPVGKLLARSLEVPEAGFLLRVADIVGPRALVTYSGIGGLAEIGPPGVTKASTLVSWCTARGISASDVWAFGDMPNDLPMLAWAGVSFAVANAHPDVRAAVARSCPSNADDGVACVIESLITRRDVLASYPGHTWWPEGCSIGLTSAGRQADVEFRALAVCRHRQRVQPHLGPDNPAEIPDGYADRVHEASRACPGGCIQFELS